MKTCKYKGREYEVKLIRSFEWGEKACLRFLNAKPDDKDFWVKSELISDIRESDGPPAKAPAKARPLTVGEPCPTCGKVYTDDDSEIPF